MPKVPTLSTTAIISTAVAGVASTAASGSQRWNGHSGALTANANMKPRNSACRIAGLALEPARAGGLDDGAEVERARGEHVAARGHHVQPDHGGQHDQPAEQVVQQELHRGLRATGTAESADQEVHRDQHGFEEHVEQQDVQRDQRDQHHALDGQRQRDVGVRRPARQSVVGRGVVPARHQQQRHQHRGQHHQRQGDAVQTRGCSRCRTTVSTGGLRRTGTGRPPGSNPTARATAMASTTSDTATPAYLANCLAAEGNRMMTAAPSSGTAHSTVSQGKSVSQHTPTSRMIATRSAAPASMDSA